jgi:tRNA 2-selenouridine synthase
MSASAQRVLLDVRSPAEFAQGHIPGAVAFPLFSDEERARVGTSYKQNGPDRAIELGLQIVGPRLVDYVRAARKIADGKPLALHCWRGGKRSGSMAWLLRTAGLDVVTLEGGYKAYRNGVIAAFQHAHLPLILLGGKTGVGKTAIIQILKKRGESVVDLEGLAHHKGSAFGSIGEQPQPTVEQFENDLYHALSQLIPGKRIWVENESRSIGRVFIPPGFWDCMCRSFRFQLDLPVSARLNHLVEVYAGTDKHLLEAAFRKIEKKLGGLSLKQALNALETNDFETAAEIALQYYDKAYMHAFSENHQGGSKTITYDDFELEKIAEDLIIAADQHGL